MIYKIQLAAALGMTRWRIRQRYGMVIFAPLCLLVLVLACSSCASRQAPAKSGPTAARDYTFFLFSDIHLGAENLQAKEPFTKADTQARVVASLERMRQLPGRSYPEIPAFSNLNLGPVAAPQALVILGDLTDGHKELAQQQEQWRSFSEIFPAAGVNFSGRLVPVFACAGNHDGEPKGPVRQGLVERNRQFARAGKLAAISSHGVHFALNWSGVHFISLNLCPADTTDDRALFKYGRPGPGSWNDPEGALGFLRDYLERYVGRSRQPIVLMFHYGFDSFSMNDWNWWTAGQRRKLYELLEPYQVAALLHGHNHHAEHYQWPDPKRHAAELPAYFDGPAPSNYRRYDVLSCGSTCWVIRIRGDQLIAAHFRGPDWSIDPARILIKSLKP